jgi:Novel STAND NTPase 1/PASTA domain
MTDAPPPLGRIITFYSYKGGTGRSMALANIAWILACGGRRVLCIDWDLEAPGLHRYFRPFLIDDELTATDGLMDFVDRYATEAIRPLNEGQQPESDWYLAFADFSDFVVSVNFPQFRSGGKIDLLPAGRQGDHYALTVSAFNWQNFYDRLGGGGFIDAVKQRARTQYDYILVDSRTGVSDTAGICSVQMPETLVVCFTYNNQSIKGASAVARSARAKHAKMIEERMALYRSGRLATDATSWLVADASKPYRIFPVAMRVDSGESERLAIRQTFAKRVFADLADHLTANAFDEYWKSVEVPHTAFYSYEEVLAPFKDDARDPKTLLAALLRLTRYVTDNDVVDFQFPIAPEKKQAYLESFAETPLTATRVALADSQRETSEQSVARMAEAALAEMAEADRAVARRVLLRLVRIGRDEEGGGLAPTRVPMTTFKPDERRMTELLAAHRLVTVTSDRGAASTAEGRDALFVALADPALLTSWRTLTEWITSDRDFLLWRQKLRTYMADWERSGRDRGALLSGRLLSEADLRALRREDDLNESELAYIQTSREAQVVVVQNPQFRRGDESVPSAAPTAARASRSTRRSLVIGAVLVVTALLVAIPVIWSRRAPPLPTPVQVTPVANILVPDFAARVTRDAKAMAEAVGLVVQMTEGRTPPVAFIEGIVVQQSVPPGTSASRGTTVLLTVSSLTATAPTLIGKTLSDALRTLIEERLKLGKTDSRYVPDAVKLGTVVAQQPSPGTRIPDGSTVDVVVSRAAQLRDFRIGILFVDGDAAARTLADRVRDVVKKTGTDVQLLARPAPYFSGGKQATQYEIRYSTPAERLAAQELQALLRKADAIPPFALTPIRQLSEGSISVFLPPQITLVVQGRPGDDVQVWYRGDRDKGEAPIVFTGKIGPDGRVVLSVPHAYLVLGRPVRRGGIPLMLTNETQPIVTVQLPPEAAKKY